MYVGLLLYATLYATTFIMALTDMCTFFTHYDQESGFICKHFPKIWDQCSLISATGQITISDRLDLIITHY